MEYPKLFNAKDLIDGVLKGSRINFKDDEIYENSVNKQTVESESHGEQLGALDKVADDIGSVLGKLENFSIVSSKLPEAINIKVEEKEYFKGNEYQETDRDILNKHNVTRMPSKVNKLSRSSIKIKNNKATFKMIPRPSSPTSMSPNQILRKGPVVKSKLRNFKNKIILSADSVIESAEKILFQGKENVPKEFENLIDNSLNENRYSSSSPVIDVADSTTISLSIKSSEDLVGSRKISEKKAKTFTTESDSKINRAVRSNNKLTKKKITDEKDDDAKKVQEDIRRALKINKSSSKEKYIPASLINLPPQAQPYERHVSDKFEDDFVKYKGNHVSRSIVQNLKNSCNIRSNLNVQNKLQDVPKKRNITTTRKSRPSKRIVSNFNSKKKIATKIEFNVDKSNRSVTPKTNNFQTFEDENQINQFKRKHKTRSNSTLRSISTPVTEKWKTRNYTAPAVTEPSVVKKSSTSSSECSGVRRGASLIESLRNKMLPVPKRTFSSISSKLQKETLSSGRKVSSYSSFHRSGSTISSITSRFNPTKQLREEAYRAIKNRTTFTVCGDYPAVRKALQKRGWVEKYDMATTKKLEQQIVRSTYRNFEESRNILREKNLNEICKKLMKSKLLADHQVDFYWVANAFEVDFDKIKLTKVNKFKSDVFRYSNEQGLSKAIKNAKWFNFPGVENIKHPRTYVLTRNEEIKDFIKDFRVTAAMSLLKWVILSQQKGHTKIVSSSGEIPLKAFQFATNECFKKVIEDNNPDIDQSIEEATDHEWNEFLEYYYNIVHIGHHFESSSLETEASMIEKSSYVIERLTPMYPHTEMDGTMNIWILKPAKGGQEKGIHICRTLQYIMRTAKNDENIRYVAQKYIERPLVIFDTKFDIRQWFLISSVFPLTIWMYKDCYLRFSSQTHNLRKLHKSIHPVDNSISKRRQKCSRDVALPSYNMWDSQQFKNHLSSIGLSEVYNEVTYKGMKECIVWTVLIHQDKMEKRSNSFELYEADFMLTEDFQPWLVEIRPNPTMKPTTPVTSRMCPRVLEDTIKVVVDRAENPKADTGNFELIYRQSNIASRNEYVVKGSKVSGKLAPDDYFRLEQAKRKKNKTQNGRNLSNTKFETGGHGLTEKLESLLKCIQNEKNRPSKKRLITEGTNPIKLFDGVKGSSDSCESGNLSFTNLKAQLNLFASFEDISIAEEDMNMISDALDLLKRKNNCDVLKYLMEIIERIVNRSIQNEE